MINFACTCGRRYSLPEDQAGTQFQCDQCHLLIDVPTLSELAGLKHDGTYIIGESTTDPALAHGRFDEFVQAFSKETYEGDIFEKDLRPNEADLTGVSIPTVDDSGRNRVAPPKYDPVTGELIRPLELAPVAVQPVKPIAQVYTGPVLGYAANTPTASKLGWASVWLELFKPPNMVVMFFAFFCHVVMQMCLIMLGLLFPAAVFVVLGLALLAHYGAVIISIGADDRDELPRPLGNLSLSDDFFTPLFNFVGSLILCYAPAAAFFIRLGFTPEGAFFSGTFFMLGTVLFPAVLLTITTSGSIANLRPDRVLGLIRVSGGYYIASVVEWIVVCVLYTASVAAMIIVCAATFSRGGRSSFGTIRMSWWLPTMIGLTSSIYLVHLFLWHLGLLYRGKGSAFPWIYQHQVKPPKASVENPNDRRAKARRKLMGQD